MNNRLRDIVSGFVSLVALMTMSSHALAAMIVVDAKDNSTTGGTGVSAGTFSSGQSFSVTVDPGDLWNAGALPRWSNADGLTGDLLATGSDDSGQSAGTLIGQSWGTWTQGGLTAPYGALVGRFGGVGDFFLIGTNFIGTAGQGGLGIGVLELFYFDSVSSDNTQYVTANVSAVPLPPAAWLLLSGLVGLGFVARRRS